MSVAAGWFLEKQATPYSKNVLGVVVAGAVACVPPVWPLELANVFAVGQRRGLLNETQARRAFGMLDDYDIRIDRASSWRSSFYDVLFMANHFQLTAYDAAYLELALRAKLPLATKDSALRRAAESAGAAFFDPPDFLS